MEETTIVDNEVLKAFKLKYEDIMDLSFKPYDTVIPSFKAFNGQEAICSVSFNPISETYSCWYEDDYLVTSKANLAMQFLKID